MSTLADILIVYAAARVLLGADNIQTDGLPKEEMFAQGIAYDTDKD